MPPEHLQPGRRDLLAVPEPDPLQPGVPLVEEAERGVAQQAPLAQLLQQPLADLLEEEHVPVPEPEAPPGRAEAVTLGLVASAPLFALAQLEDVEDVVADRVEAEFFERGGALVHVSRGRRGGRLRDGGTWRGTREGCGDGSASDGHGVTLDTWDGCQLSGNRWLGRGSGYGPREDWRISRLRHVK